MLIVEATGAKLNGRDPRSRNPLSKPESTHHQEAVAVSFCLLFLSAQIRGDPKDNGH